MIRDFDPAHYSGKTPAVLVLGYALCGDKEYATLLRDRFLVEEAAAHKEGRNSRHDDYVRAWWEAAREALVAEGILRPTTRELHRKLGLIREGAHGNAPLRLAPLRTYARIEREQNAHPTELREIVLQRVASELEQEHAPRKGAGGKFKTVETHQTLARRMLDTEDRLHAARTAEDLRDAPPHVIAETHIRVEALRRGIIALSRIQNRSEETEALIEKARKNGLID
jgi:hypothetical protein